MCSKIYTRHFSAGQQLSDLINVVAHMAPVMMHKSAVIAQYPHLFKCLGCLQGAFHIKLKGDTRFALTTTRRVAILLKMKGEG